MRLVALALAAILAVSCASSGGGSRIRTREDALAQWRVGTIPLRVENNVYEAVTVYVVNGGSRMRIGDCPGVSRCWLWVNASISDRIYSEGQIQLGWRFFGGPAGLQGPGTLATWEGLTTVLTLNRANWFMRSEVFAERKAE